MVNIKEKIYAEDENIIKILREIEKLKNRPNKESVIVVGIGAYLQNIYTGMENILKQLLLYKQIQIPDTPIWHKNLLNLAIEHNFISKEIADKIGKYLFFRHFFMHSYGFLIDEKKLKPLMDNASEVYSDFKREIDIYLAKIKE